MRFLERHQLAFVISTCVIPGGRLPFWGRSSKVIASFCAAHTPQNATEKRIDSTIALGKLAETGLRMAGSLPERPAHDSGGGSISSCENAVEDARGGWASTQRSNGSSSRLGSLVGRSNPRNGLQCLLFRSLLCRRFSLFEHVLSGESKEDSEFPLAAQHGGRIHFLLKIVGVITFVDSQDSPASVEAS